MSCWFSASAVVPALRVDWGITAGQATLLTVAVQLGFVTGAVTSAALNVSDLFPAHAVVAVSALVASASTAVIALTVDSLAPALLLRFVTGMALAGVYPTGLKLMTSWFDRGRGLALGVLVAALTLGSALPQLVSSFAALPWRGVLVVSALLSLTGAIVAWLLVRPGPLARPAPPLHPRYVLTLFTERGPLLANLGYFGHMWELYAMWTWTPAYLAASLAEDGSVEGSRTVVGLAAFTVIGVAGVVGCLGGGLLGDRLGRARVAGWAMRVSAACCLLAALVFGQSPWLVLPVLLLWGASVIADSGLFSSCVADVADPRYVGTALTTQTAVGFLLTVATINAVPYVVEVAGWPAATALLAIGPVAGAVAMAKLHRLLTEPA
ncbi:MFS transporter [Nocardioides sp. MJB4]|uniref:MFS transporter n=2 Tax=Nocardioides donggukensis TaxID=2774019 RepID=A0A927K9A6_9ACTN|nr:MFS transporter [Nocardioides donggukensis]